MKLFSLQLEQEYCTITDGVNSIRLKQYHSSTPKETREIIEATKSREGTYPQDLFEQEIVCIVLQNRADIPTTKLAERVNAGESSLLVEDPSGFEDGDEVSCGGKKHRIIEIQGNRLDLSLPVDIAIAKKSPVVGVVNLETLFSNVVTSSLVHKIFQFYQSESNFGKERRDLFLSGMRANELAIARAKEINGYVVGIGQEYAVFASSEDIPDKIWQQINSEDGQKLIEFLDFSGTEKKPRRSNVGKSLTGKT